MCEVFTRDLEGKDDIVIVSGCMTRFRIRIAERNVQATYAVVPFVAMAVLPF